MGQKNVLFLTRTFIVPPGVYAGLHFSEIQWLDSMTWGKNNQFLKGYPQDFLVSIS